MNREKLKIAIQEAERFLERAKALPDPVPYPIDGPMAGLYQDNFPKEQGAIKRSSLDLSRALSDLRKP